MNLEEIIKQRLAEATSAMQVSEAAACDLKAAKKEKKADLNTDDEVVMDPKKKTSLTTEDLDAMSDEEFTAIDQEQLDEVSKATLGSYVKKPKTAESVKSVSGEDIDVDGSPDEVKAYAKKHGVVLTKNSGTEYSHFVSGPKANVRKFLINHYDGEDDAKELHPKVFESAKCLVKESAYDTDMFDEKNKDKPVQVHGVKGMKSTPFKKKFKTYAHFEKWADSEDAGDHEVHQVKLAEETSTEVSSQVAALLEAEGLSDDFKLQAVTIFEAAVADRVLQIEERMEQEFKEQLDEAVAEIESDIDGFVNEAILEWKATNEVALKANFKTQMNESLVDGLMSLLAEHNVDIESGKEDALETALSEVAKLEESVSAAAAEKQSLQEQIDSLTAKSILESFRTKMTQTEFDRFGQLTESIKYVSDEQYTKQLSIVLENFSVFKAAPKKETIVESAQTLDTTPVIVQTDSRVQKYAQYISSKKI